MGESVPVTEVTKNFELYQKRALRAPVTVTRRGRPSVVILAADEYERLRARLGGIGAAHVVHGACSGCNLALSSTELDHLRHAASGTISHCEQCGRILVAL